MATTRRAAAGGAKRPKDPSAAPPPAPAPPRGVMSAAEVLAELSDIAAARPGDGEAPAVKTADKLKALEMLRRYHEQAAGQAAEGESLTIRLEVLDGADA